MIYQDTWINGSLHAKGIRECESRYQIIKGFCDQKFHEPFTVLDIGANMCYFGLRLIEDFGCSVMAFEFNSFEMREEIVKKNKTNKLLFLKRKISIADLNILAACCQFDLVLAMSVMHHLPGDHNEWLQAFKAVGKNAIVEYALEDSKRTAIRENYAVPKDATWLGYADSHLNKNINRPIVLL